MTLPSLATTALLVSAIASERAATATAQSNPRPKPGDPNFERPYEQCPQMPSLHCKNGSTCTEGIATFDKRHDHLNMQTHENGYYCKCLPGYIGHECGIQVDDCDGDSGYNPSDPTGVLQSCYHGSTCKKGGEKGFYCDCKTLNNDSSPTAMKFAGLMCQHESTGLCAASLVGESAPSQQFCTNHGQCVKMVTAGEPHPGCVCKEGWMGDHCEIRQDPFALIQPSTESTNSTAGKVLFSLLIIVMGVVVGAIAILLMKAIKNKQTPGVGASTAGKNTVVGAGDLNPDGSGTLGKNIVQNDDDENSQFEIGDEEHDGHIELQVEDTAGEGDINEKPAEDDNDEGIGEPEIV